MVHSSTHSHREDGGTNELEPWAIEKAEVVVGVFLRDHWIDGYDEMDLQQEVLELWLKVRHEYQPVRGASVRTFFDRVANSQLFDLLAHTMAEKRMPKQKDLSLEAEVGGADDEQQSLMGLVADGAADLDDHSVQAELRDRLMEAEQTLSPRQKVVWRGILAGFEKKELAEHLNVSRDTVYEDLKKVRRAFADAGLDEYLR